MPLMVHNASADSLGTKSVISERKRKGSLWGRIFVGSGKFIYVYCKTALGAVYDGP